MRHRKLLRSTYAQHGQALVIALIFMMIIVIIGLSFAGMYNGQLGRLSRNTAYVHGYTAQYIAEAGIDRFLWVLNSQWGNQDNYDFLHETGTYTFSGYYPDGQGYYYLTVLNVGGSTPDAVQVTSTGWLKSDPANEFTIKAELAVQQFTQNLFFTDYEQTSPDGGSAPVHFTNNNIMDGPVRTNDVFHIDGNPQFNGGPGSVKYAAAPTQGGGDSYDASDTRGYDGTGNPIGSWPPKKVTALPLPGAGSLKQFAQNGGYYFSGRTCIYLHGTEMDVVTYDNDPDNYPPDDGSTCTADDGRIFYREFHEMDNLPLPSNGVIYVDGNQDSSCDGGAAIVGEENTTQVRNGGDYYGVSTYNGRDLKFTNDMGNVFVSSSPSDPFTGQLTIGANNNIYVSWADPCTPYEYADGETAAQRNAASGGLICSGSNSMLGLCAQNYVLLMRYDWPLNPCSGSGTGHAEAANEDDQYTSFNWELLSTDTSAASAIDDLPYNVTIDGVVMTNNLSFTLEGIGIYNYQNPREGLGTITLDGSLIQEYRGIVQTYSGATAYLGYDKSYSYDSRLLYETPPHFVQPSEAGWGVLNWQRAPPATVPAMSAPVLGAISGNGSGPNGLTVTHGAGKWLALSTSVTPAGACPTVQWSVVNPSGTSPEIDPYSGYLYNLTAQGSFTVCATSADTSVPVSTTGIVTVN
jgi:hypothetical protein